TGVLAETDPRLDLGIRAHGRARLARDQTQGAQVAGGVAGREQLLRVGSVAALAAHFGWNGQADVDLAVVCGRAALVTSSAGSRGVGAVQDFHETDSVA